MSIFDVWAPTIKLNYNFKELFLKKKENYRKLKDAWGWCTGTTQRDGMGREEGGGFRMGNTCIPVADSF